MDEIEYKLPQNGDQLFNRRIRLTQVYTIYGISTKGVYPREFHLQIQEQ